MKEKIIVAVSGGADSMALLAMLLNKDYKLVVAHVNYQVRDQANFDQKLVESFCSKHNLICEVLLAPKIESGNFQSKARKIRYNFFNDLAKKHQIKSVYVAHHLDDHLETYLMQKKRKITPSYYGLNTSVKYKDIILKRILLNYSKQDLIDYCNKHQIEFAEDVSNYSKKYLRNKIRLEIVDKLNKDEKIKLLLEIESENKKLAAFNLKLKKAYKLFIENKSIDYLLSFDSKLSKAILRKYFKSFKIFQLSDDELSNILTYLKSDNNKEYYLNKQYSLFKDYGYLVVDSNDYQFNFNFDKLTYGNYNYFQLKSEGKVIEGLTVGEDDFPITIRNYQAGDKIKLRFGTKSVNRFFIDNKISLNLRRKWPIVLNKHKEVIFVVGIGCNISHFSNNNNLFVVK